MAIKRESKGLRKKHERRGNRKSRHREERKAVYLNKFQMNIRVLCESPG